MENNLETNNKQLENKRNPGKLVIIGSIFLVAVFGLGFAAGQGSKIGSNSGTININKGDVSNNADYSLLWDALDELNSKFVDRPLDQQKLLYGAISGLVSATGDPYTTFFDPQQAEQFQEELNGSFDGIGAEIGVKDSQIVIIAPLDETPAQKAGLQPGDAILSINNESTSGLSVEQAVSKIRGKAGTEVTLTVLHEKQNKPTEIKITRARIEIKSVKLESKEVDGSTAAGGTSKKIAWLKVARFGEDTKSLFDHSVDVILAGNYSGVILDLRNNPGGYLDVSVNLASNWVENGKVVVKEKGYSNREKDYKAEGLARLKGIKTIVLVNEGSASASEIVAGALQDYKLATLVGEKTFGKGSVQELSELKGKSELKITVAKWFTPNGRGIDKTGLEPDVKVEMTIDDYNNKKDPQMDKALELLR